MAGVTFGTAQKTLAAHRDDTTDFRLVREPHNRFDANAIRVELHGESVGHVPAEIAADLAPAWDVGASVCWVERGNVHRFDGDDSTPILIAYIDIVEEVVEDGKQSRQTGRNTSVSNGKARPQDNPFLTLLIWFGIFLLFMAMRWLMSASKS